VNEIRDNAQRQAASDQGLIEQLRQDVKNRETKIEFEIDRREEIQCELNVARQQSRQAEARADTAEAKERATRHELEAKVALLESEVQGHQAQVKEVATKRVGVEQVLRKTQAECMVLHHTLEGRERKIKSLQAEVRHLTGSITKLNQQVFGAGAPHTLDTAAELNSTLMGDIKAKNERLKIAEMNERSADQMIAGLKAEVEESKNARDKLKQYEIEFSKASKQLIVLMKQARATEANNKALRDEVAQLKLTDSRELQAKLLKSEEKLRSLEEDKNRYDSHYVILNDHALVLARKLESEQHTKRRLHDQVSKLASQLGNTIDLPQFGPGMLTITLNEVRGLKALGEHELEIATKSESGGGGDKNDPYVRFKVKNQSVDSTVQTGAGTSATFGMEQLSLEIPANDCLLSAKVADWERFGAHRTLGKAWFDLSQLKAGRTDELILTLQPQGTISFTVQYTPYKK